VRVDLDEHPLGAPGDVNALLDPRRDPRRRRWVVPGDRAVLEAEAVPALAGEGERPGDHEQAIVVAVPDARTLAGLVAAASREVADGPVDLVDHVGLARIGGRRERQIDVAAELVQYDELVVDATPPAIRPAVREAPVAVDERPPVAGALAAVPRQMTVSREHGEVVGDPRRERRGGVAVVVQVELDLAEPGARELAEPTEEVR